MRRILAGLVVVFVLPLGAWAVESSVSCTVDTWVCTEWSMCGPDRLQSRVCQKTIDCPAAETPPKPPERQACGPGCTEDVWSCSGWSVCGANGKQQRFCTMTGDCPLIVTPSPPREQQCRLDCGPDIWACTAWSSCNAAGERTRSCARRTICEDPEVFPPKPAERERCALRATPKPTTTPPAKSIVRRRAASVARAKAAPPALLCSRRPTLDARVRCRLERTLEELSAELSEEQVPEECRALAAGADRSRCVDRNEFLRPCMELPIGPERFSCSREALGVPEFRELPARYRPPCESEDAEFSRRCAERYRRERAYPAITFRFQELRARAELFRDLGTLLEPVARFIATAEQATIDFNASRSTEERTTIIRRVQNAWRAFVAEIPEDIRARVRSGASTQ